MNLCRFTKNSWWLRDKTIYIYATHKRQIYVGFTNIKTESKRFQGIFHKSFFLWVWISLVRICLMTRYVRIHFPSETYHSLQFGLLLGYDYDGCVNVTTRLVMAVAAVKALPDIGKVFQSAVLCWAGYLYSCSAKAPQSFDEPDRLPNGRSDLNDHVRQIVLLHLDLVLQWNWCW